MDQNEKQLREQIKILGKVAEGLKQDMQTIEVLTRHMLADIRENKPAHTMAALCIGEAIGTLAGAYR